MLKIPLQRLLSQELARTKFKQAGDVVAWMGGIQAQDYAGAKWSIGLRLSGAAEEGIEQAIDNKNILRTWAMRGTLHFVSPADIRWLLELVASRIITNNARRYKELELDDRTFVRSNDVIAEALRDGKQLDRSALVAILERKGISTAGQRTPYLLQKAGLDRIIYQGAMRSNNPTFLLLDESLPKTRPFKRDDALYELAFRYFRSRGPATIQDFIWWSGLSGADANAGLDAAKSELARETIDGQTYWQGRSISTTRYSASTVYLLPGFDEYLLSYKDRSASMDVKRLRALTPANGMLPPTIVMSGIVVGTWKRTLKKDAVVIAAKPLRPFTTAESRAFGSAARRYGEFLGLPAVLAQMDKQ